MLRKISIFIFTLIFLSNTVLINAQTNSEQEPAHLRFTLTDYRNPSQIRGRYGLFRFSSDSKLLATSGTDRDIKIYNVENGELVATIDSKKAGLVGKEGFNAFSFSPDGKYAVAQEEGYANIVLFDSLTGEVVRKIDGRGKVSSFKKLILNSAEDIGGLEMSTVSVDSDWEKILIAKNDGVFQVVDFETGEIKNTLKHTSNSSDVWDFMKWMFQSNTFIPLSYLISSGRFSEDGKKIIIANGDKSPTLWNAETGERIAELEPQTDRVYTAFFSPDSRFVVTTDVDGATKIWSAETGELISAFGSKKDRNIAVAWNADSSVLVTISPKDDARFWDAEKGETVLTLEKSRATTAVFNPDKTLIATIHEKNKRQLAQIWNAETGELIATLPRSKKEDRAFSLVWSPDGKMLITASNDFVKVWDSKGNLLQDLNNAVFPATFSEDGKYLATGGKNNTGYVWQIGKNIEN